MTRKVSARFTALLALSAILFTNVFAGVTLAAVSGKAPAPAMLVSEGIVISQVYGGGGNAGATFTHDFVELFNRGNSAISIGGWSIQYASATGTGNFGSSATLITELPNVTIQPGQYYLVQQASNAAVGAPLPTPDLIDPTPIQMAAGAGKVALASISTSLGCNGGSTACTPAQLANIIDLVGFGNANFFEGAGAVGTLSATSSGARNNGGCVDTDNNNLDFTVINPPAPRNSSSTANPCGVTPTNPTGIGNANPDTVAAGNASLLTVTVTPGTNPTSTGIAVNADLTNIGGLVSQQFFDNGTNGDQVAGDGIFSYSATVAPGTGPGPKSLPATVGDLQGRSSIANISLTVSAPVPTGQPLPFSQNWSDTSLITTDNDWSGVPGIVGYRGDAMTGATAVDPQTVLQDGSGTPLNVAANLTNPNIATSGGIAEFHLPDPVVAMQGSGTARAPHLVISVNTSGHSNIGVFYNLRDVDGSADNSVQPVALQYRVGNTGDYTNVPAAFVGDASSGPNEATKVTPVAVILPAAVNDQPLVQVRIITTDAVGSDEWIGIDDIQIVPNGTIPISGSGSATPNSLNAGTSTLLTVTVNSATNPSSSGITVNCDLTAIGGPGAQPFFDDGTNGDVIANDGVFSYLATVSADTFSGGKVLPVSIADAQARTATTSIALTVRAARSPDIHLTMGNPSNAVTDANNPLNYLLPKDEYVLSYNRDRGTANWVSWHLDSSWIGSAPRQDDFRPDESLPAGWYRVTQFDYSGSGFDRGHHTPSGDRTATIPENSATFLMTNMMPQAPGNNQGPWEQLESFTRALVNQGNEAYIVMGGTGTGGTGSLGGVTTTIASGNVTVPAFTWKVIMVLPNGGDDVARVDVNTRLISVIMPNADNIRMDQWQKYSATVDQVEALTGYDFFSNVPVHIQEVIEARPDAATNTAPTAQSQTVQTDEDIDVAITLTATDPNVNNELTFTVTSGPSNGQLSGEGANLTYTPNQNFNGQDSFVFEVSDGVAVSGGTVTIDVAPVNDAPVLAPISDQTVFLGGTLNFTASATDADLPNDTLTFSLTGTVPSGASIDPVTGEFTWTPTVQQAGAIYTFGVRVTDAEGLYHDRTVNVGVAFEWSGLLPPLSGSNPSIKAGSTAPVKFELTGLSSGVTNATARLFYARVLNGIPGPESPAQAAGNSNQGNLFRFSGGQYIFNWKTTGVTPGLYQLRIDLGDGVLRTALITLR